MGKKIQISIDGQNLDVYDGAEKKFYVTKQINDILNGL